jgi:hypothetical protein
MTDLDELRAVFGNDTFVIGMSRDTTEAICMNCGHHWQPLPSPLSRLNEHLWDHHETLLWDGDGA